MKMSWFFFLFTSLICTVCNSTVLHKTDAFEILKSQGFKWQLTNTMSLEAEAKTMEARSAMNPKLQFGVRQYAARINPIQYGSTALQDINTVGFGTTAIEMSWSIIDSLAKSKIMSAEANEKMTEAQAKHFQSELTALMLIQYLNVQRLKQQIDVMNANISKSEIILKLAMAKKAVGAGIPLDIARAKNLVQLDRLKKLSVYTKYMKARHELALSLSLEKLDVELEPLFPTILKTTAHQETLDKALSSRQDLHSAEIGMQAVLVAKDEASKLFFPKLSLLGEVGTTQPTIFGLPPKSVNGFIGVSLTIPISSGGLIESKRRETAALQMKAELNLKEMRAEAASQVKESLEQLLAAEEALHGSDEYLKTSEEESHIAERKFTSGASNLLDLTIAHTNLAGANDTRIENIFNYEAAKVSYFRSLGDFTDYFKNIGNQ